MSTGKNPGIADTHLSDRRRRIRLAAAVAVIVAAGVVAAAFLLRPPAHASQTSCSAAPSKCGFPDATTTGVQPSATLQAVPGKVTSGTGWSWDASSKSVEVTTAGANITGLNISGALDITANNVTVNGVHVTGNGGNFGVSLRHTTGATIENSTIAGSNATTGRISAGISDVYGDSTGMVIKNNDISNFKT